MLHPDLWFLPKVNIRDRKHLPEEAGVYFAIDSRGDVRYVGLASNLYARWNGKRQHDRLDQLLSLRGGAWLRYRVLPDNEIILRYFEAAAIERYNPDFNVQRPNPEKYLTVGVRSYLLREQFFDGAVTVMLSLVLAQAMGIPIFSVINEIVRDVYEERVR